MNRASDTFVTQAFGLGNLRKCGVYLNKARIILLVILIPTLILIIIFAKQIAWIFTRDEKVIEYAVQYTRIFCTAFIFLGLVDSLRKFHYRT